MNVNNTNFVGNIPSTTFVEESMEVEGASSPDHNDPLVNALSTRNAALEAIIVDLRKKIPENSCKIKLEELRDVCNTPAYSDLSKPMVRLKIARAFDLYIIQPHNLTIFFKALHKATGRSPYFLDSYSTLLQQSMLRLCNTVVMDLYKKEFTLSDFSKAVDLMIEDDKMAFQKSMEQQEVSSSTSTGDTSEELQQIVREELEKKVQDLAEKLIISKRKCAKMDLRLKEQIFINAELQTDISQLRSSTAVREPEMPDLKRWSPSALTRHKIAKCFHVATDLVAFKAWICHKNRNEAYIQDIFNGKNMPEVFFHKIPLDRFTEILDKLTRLRLVNRASIQALIGTKGEISNELNSCLRESLSEAQDMPDDLVS